MGLFVLTCISPTRALPSCPRCSACARLCPQRACPAGSGSALLLAGPGSSARKQFFISTRSLGPSVHRTELPSTVLAKDMLRNNIWDRTV